MPKLKLEKLVQSQNIAELLDKEDLDKIGSDAVEGYLIDESTRDQWKQRSEKAIKLALQVKEFKSFPWENCSNVKFPLLTIAALQFLARISLMTKGRQLVKCEAIGADPDGAKMMQARRISTHMSLQLTDEDKNWIDQDEQAKMAASIVGSAFKNTYYDGVEGVNRSEHVPAANFVVDYYCKDIDKAFRATHLMEMDDNAIQERVRRGLFCEMDEATPSSTGVNILQQAADDTQGLTRPQVGELTSYQVLQQHTWLDLDGDGYREPYILFVRLDTKQVLRIVARYFDEGDVHRVNDNAITQLENRLVEMRADEKVQQQGGQVVDTMAEQSRLERMIDKLEKADDNHIVRIDPTLHFTRYLFIPSPDGGVYGLGLGALLGPVNEAVDSLVNQLVDAGTMANTAGGFLGRGVKIKGGKTSFDPFEWKPVDSTGDDLRKNIFPLPVREPSAVLFQLLGMLVTYGEKISGATDIMTGVAPGQNTPAETSRNTVEQGMMLFSGIYSRMYRAFKDEVRKFYNLNKLYLPYSPRYAELTVGPNAIISKDDYTTNNFRIVPSANPEAVSQTQRRDKALMLHQLAVSQPGFNVYLVTRNLLEALDYEDIDRIYPDPKGPNAVPPPQNPKVELEKAKLQQQAKEHQDQIQLDIMSLRSEIEIGNAKVMELQAKAQEHLANADGVKTGHQIAIIEAQLGAAKARNEGLMSALSTLQRHHEAGMKHEQTMVKASAGGKAQGESPASQ